MEYLKAIVLALIEGATEFLPVSSTGHLIIAEEYIHLGGNPAFSNTFLVAIQLPAILAVAVYFWGRLWPFSKGNEPKQIIGLWVKIVIAFLPAAVLGFLFDDFIEAHLFNRVTVACALIVGGVVLIVLEGRKKEARYAAALDIPIALCVAIGFFQCLAMIPGTSRSAATIIGAMLLGAARPAAAEFSFFLAIPTMCGATAYTLLKHGLGFSGQEWALLGVGSAVSFLSALAVIAWFMAFIKKHTFVGFGWYRIALGAAVLLLFYCLG